MGPEEVQLPPDLPNWRVVKDALRELRGKLVNKTTNPQEVGWFMQIIYNTIQSDQSSPGNVSSQLSLLKAKVQAKVKQKLDITCVWYGVVKFLKKVPSEEREQFMASTMPFIIEFALKIEEFMRRETIVWSKQQIGGKIALSRKFVCSIVACFFLCLFPERKRHGKQPVNIINFTTFFKHMPIATQIAKMRCILHYFECVIVRNMEIEGSIVIHRKVASPFWMLNFNQLMESPHDLCPLTILPDGKMEDSERDAIHICFGNKSLGGGVLGKSRVQEEIKFCTCPELIAAMLMVENMEDNEAVEISGFEQMSCYRGYGDSFQFDGHCSGALADCGQYRMVTMDATSFRGKESIRQYEEECVLRDLNKALIGFCDMASRQINPAVDEGKPCSASSHVTSKRKTSTSRSKSVTESSMSPSTCLWRHPVVECATSPPATEPGLHYSSLDKAEKEEEGESPIQHEDIHLLESEGHQQSKPHRVQCTTQWWADLNATKTAYVSPSPSSPTSAHWERCDHLQEPSASYSSSPLSLHLTNRAGDISGSPQSHNSFQFDNLPSAFPPAMSSSSPCPIPLITAATATTTTIICSTTSAAESFSPTWPHLDSPFHPFPFTADTSAPSPSSRIHSNSGEPPTSIGVVDLLSGDVSSLPADSAIGTGNASQTDDDPQRPTSPQLSSALSASSFQSGHEGSFPGAKYYSDVLGNLTTADSGARVVLSTPTVYPLTPFQPAAAATSSVEKDYNCCHSSAFSVKLKDETNQRLSARSGFESEPRSLTHGIRHPEVERTGSDVSNYSTQVCVGSQSASVYSLDEFSSIATSPSQEGPSLGVDHNSLPLDDSLSYLANKSSPARISDFSSTDKAISIPLGHTPPSLSEALLHLEPPESPSPHSSAPSLNHSPNSSFGVQDSSCGKLAEESLIPGIFSHPRNGARDFHSEVRDWISASSSSSAIPALSSSSHEGSRWGSRSGSLSSHGTSGSHHDMGDLWANQRRRSSQMSDMSRRSSSSKHSSDLSTDLEEISETLAKHGHTVIEEEGSQMALNLDDMDVAEHVPADELHGATQDHLILPQLVGDVKVDDGNGTESDHDKFIAMTNDRISINQPTTDSGDFGESFKYPLSTSGDRRPHIPSQGSTQAVIHAGHDVPGDGGDDIPRGEKNGQKDSQSSGAVCLISKTDDLNVSSAASVDESWWRRNDSSSCLTDERISVEKHEADTSYITLPSKTITFNHDGNYGCPDDPLKGPEQQMLDGYSCDRVQGSRGEDATDAFSLASSRLSVKSSTQDFSSDPNSSTAAMMDTVSQGARPKVRTSPKVSRHESSSSTSKRHRNSSKETVIMIPERDLPPIVSSSRYLFSDVASAPGDRTKYEYRVVSPLLSGMSGFLKCASESSKTKRGHGSVRSGMHVSSPLISLFISNLAKIIVNKACAEGAKVAAASLSRGRCDKEIFSDEIYSMFAMDIVNQVFVHVLSSIESKDLLENALLPLPLNLAVAVESDEASEGGKLYFQHKSILEGGSNPELPLSSPITPPPSANAIYLNLHHHNTTADLSSLSQRQAISSPKMAATRPVPTLTAVNSKPSIQKPKNSSASISKVGISKTVSFEDSCMNVTTTTMSSDASHSFAGGDSSIETAVVVDLSAVVPIISPSTSTSTVFQQAGSLNSLSLSRDSSLSAFSQPVHDATIQVTPPPPPQQALLTAVPSVPRLAHSQSAIDLTSKHTLTISDYDIYQTATAIVSQVFQSISDSFGSADGPSASLVGGCGFNDASSVDSSLSASVKNSRWGQGEAFTSNIFSSSSVKTNHHHHHHHHHHHRHHHHSSSSTRYSCQSPSMGVVSRKPMSREGLTNAFLKVDSSPSVKTYERRSSEPCHTSVQLSLQAFNDNRFSCKQKEEQQNKLSATDDEIHQGRTWRRGSLDGFSFGQRRNSCGFKDPVLSRFAEELMKADTSVPELVIFGSRQSSSTTGSRRSSISGFKDTTLANLESELLNTSFTSICSLSVSQSQSPRSQHRNSRATARSRSWELRQGKSDSSDTEHLFPLPRYVGNEFLQEYRKQYGHEDDDKDISGSNNSLPVPMQGSGYQWDPELKSREERAMDMFATSLSNNILLEAFSCHCVDGQAVAMSRGSGEEDGFRGEEIDHQVVSGNLSTRCQATDLSPYFSGEGARPKIVTEAIRTSSKARTIPQKKFGNHHRRDDSPSSDGLSYNSVSSESIFRPIRRRTSRSNSPNPTGRRSFIPLFNRLMSQERHWKAHHQQSVSSSSSVPALLFSSSGSLPTLTTASANASRFHRRHMFSQSASGQQLSGSSSDVTSSSATSVPKAVRREERRRRVSSETPRSLDAEDAIDTSYLDSVLKSLLRYEHCRDDSVESTISSCSDLSGQTRSSLLSSSLSDSEGSRPRVDSTKAKASNADRKKRMIVRQAALVKESGRTFPSTPASQGQGRARRDRGRKRSVTKPRPKKHSREMAYQFLYPKEDIYAETLSRTIVAEAFKDFTQLKWNVYTSYNRSVATGNWGCGAFKGNAQLKLVMQWIAASIARVPCLLYYTFGDSRLVQAKEVVHELSTWSVCDLSMALRDYCHWARCHLSEPNTSAPHSMSWIYGLLHLKIGCGRQPSSETSQQEVLPVSLFDFLLNFHKTR